MKRKFIDYFKKELSRRQKSVNTLSDDAKKIAEEGIEEIKNLISELENLEEEVDAKILVKEIENKFNEKLSALGEKIETSKKAEEETENFLKSTNAMKEFFRCWKESSNGLEMAFAWNEVLSKNGISTAEGSAEALLPESVRGAIKNAWESPKNWLNRLKATGAKRYMVRTETTADSSTDVRAKGHAGSATKTTQSQTLSLKDVKAQMVYKLIDIPRMTEWNNEQDLLNYIQKELVSQWIKEVERCVLVGDGRASNSADKITSIEAVAGSSTTTYMTAVQYTSSKTMLEQMVDLAANINESEGMPILFTTKAILNELRKVEFSSTGTPQYLSKEDVAAQIGVEDIITTNLIGSSYKGIMMVPQGYVLVGGIAPVLESSHDIKTNVTYYRAENPIGGAIESPKSCATLYV